MDFFIQYYWGTRVKAHGLVGEYVAGLGEVENRCISVVRQGKGNVTGEKWLGNVNMELRDRGRVTVDVIRMGHFTVR